MYEPTDLSDTFRASEEFRIYNPEIQPNDPSKWDIKRDGKQSYLVMHYMVDSRIKNYTYARLKENNLKTVVLQGKSSYG